jgi:hypothetical protein
VIEQGAKDAVNSSGIKAQLGQAHLKFGHVVTSQVRMGEIQQSFTETPSGFNQSSPGHFINVTGNGETLGALEGLDERHGLFAESASIVA